MSQNVDAKKKPLLRENAPEVAAMQGAAHMDNDVGRMMEIAGTKAARRNTVMLNERKYATYCCSCTVQQGGDQ